MEIGERLIGIREGEREGPLFIAIGQIHGNEPAGTQAIKELFHLIEREYILQPRFEFAGTFVGLVGNIAASNKKQRFIDTDLNRAWPKDGIFRKGEATHGIEHQERKTLFQSIQHYVQRYGDRQQICILDLHTTTAQGGVFAIPAPDPLSQKIAHALHAPVVDKLFEGLPGTLVLFASKYDWGFPVSSLVFESGQHNSADAVGHAISALVNCMRTLGMVHPGDVEHKHDVLLRRLSHGLPKATELVYRHPIVPEDDFVMLPGFQNFSPIRNGQQLAHDKNGPIFSPTDGLMLMPLYQPQGEDGFFVLKAK